MEFLDSIDFVAIGGILVDLVIISMIISHAFWGYRRGLTAVIFKVLTFIVSLLIMFVLYKSVSNLIIENTTLDEKLSTAIAQNLSGTTLSDGKLLEAQDTNVSSGLVELINTFFSEALNSAQENAIQYASGKIAILMIQVGTMLGLFIISRTLLLFVRFAAELIANLPIIRLFNKSGGLIYGILKGLLTAYAILAILSVASPLISNLGIISAIEDSRIGNSMYNNNIILNVITNNFKKL